MLSTSGPDAVAASQGGGASGQLKGESAGGGGQGGAATRMDEAALLSGCMADCSGDADVADMAAVCVCALRQSEWL